MWRYHELLPVETAENVISLGEGGTPLILATNLGKRIGFQKLYLKDDGQNPTGSFKARGLSVAISKAHEFGIKKVVTATAGNAGGATAAYCAKAQIMASIFMPIDTPVAFSMECQVFGAKVEKINGLIGDCNKEIARRNEDWFSVSTLREPYRIEGKKTMGYEIAEQFNWVLPDVIVYPTGGGTGLIGMWKAFEELEKLGFIDSKRPRMISVQSTGCAPIVKAFNEGKNTAEVFPNAQTIASGIRVPNTIGDFLILDAIRSSGGTAIAVPDETLISSTKLIAETEGIFCSPECGSTLSCLLVLKEQGVVNEHETILLYLTGSGIKYIDVFSTAGL